MITTLKGTITALNDQKITVDVHGIGFEITVAHPTSFTSTQNVELIIHLHWNAEQGPSLFGFTSATEKKLFLLIIDCPGIGPKLGISLLHQLSPGEFIQAIQGNNIEQLSSLHGIGKKKAEQLIVQLKDKVTKLLTSGMLETKDITSHAQEIAQVLTSLNYSRPEIATALEFIAAHKESDQEPFDLVLRKALTFLAKRR